MTVTKLDVGRLGAGARKQIAEATKAPAPKKRPGKRSRFGSIKAQVDGIKFDSRLEARYYLVLRDRQRRGEIRELVVHPVYDLSVDGIWVAKFIPDFRFVDATGTLRFHDTKGGKDGAATTTDVFRIKARLFRALTGHTVEIIGS